MGTYKVIQDIESEDKLLGPLSLRQFIYAVIVIVCGLVAFKLLMVKWFLAIPFLPFMMFFGLLAAPFGHDQSSEVWLLAKIRFAIKPRKRVWDQSGLKDLVTITVPKVIEKHLTKDLSQTEVQNRLRALASTIDTRGWAVKNVDSNLFQHHSDRLVEGTGTARQVTDDEIKTEFDILDYYDNPTVQHVDDLINSTERLRHQQLVDMMQQNRAQTTEQQPTANGQWFADNTQTAVLPQPQNPTQQYDPAPAQPAVQQVPPPQEPVQQQPIEVAPAVQAPFEASRPAINPITQPQNPAQQYDPAPAQPAVQQVPPPQEPVQSSSDGSGISIDHSQPITPPQEVPAPTQTPSASPVTAQPDAAIIDLANNDDLNIATIARQADKVVEQNNGDEVVISLH